MNRICEDTAGYELWSTSGSSKRMPVRVRVRGVRVRVEDIGAKTQASSVNPLNNSCYLVGILCLNSPTIPVFK